MQLQHLDSLPRSSSTNSASKMIMPLNYARISSHGQSHGHDSENVHARKSSPVTFQLIYKTGTGIMTLLRSLLSIIALPAYNPGCRWIVPTHFSFRHSIGRKVTGTLFGNRRGLVSFAVQDTLRSEPVLVVELALSTATLVKEMSSGLVRIALECEKRPPVHGRSSKLFNEPMWTMYCNGKMCGYAPARACTESDRHVLRTVQSVSVGAGVIPVVDDGEKDRSEGELLYMRARFERVVGSRDSQAFYMMNPDGNGGAELSIFLLRI